jgi:hypothetical protein
MYKIIPDKETKAQRGEVSSKRFQSDVEETDKYTGKASMV